MRRHDQRPRHFRDFPFNPARSPFFYGWAVLGAGTLGMVMTAPGQTIGVSVFTDSLIGALQINRSLLSMAYLVGTLGSSFLLSRAGRVYDRRGGRLVGASAAILLALSLVYLSYSSRISVGLHSALPGISPAVIAFAVITVGFFLIRFAGQGVLALSSRNMAMEWFEKRRGLANAVIGIATSFGFSYAPRVFAQILDRTGWEIAWRWIAAGVAAFALVAITLYRDTPEIHGLKPDGGAVRTRHRNAESTAGPSFTPAQARRTYAFWVFALTLFVASLTGTAFTFHVVSIFADAGMARSDAVGIFLPASVVAIILGFGGSWLSDRIKLKYLGMVFVGGVIVLALAPAILAPGWPRILAIVGQGMLNGMFGIISSITWPRFFGRKHLGAISGLSATLAVAGSAVGPYFYSLGRDISGSYVAPGIVVGVLALGLLVAMFRADRPELGGAVN